MFSKTYIVILVYLIKNVSSNLHVQTTSGPIRGVSSLSENVEAFLGIPYAEPPIGDLRFAKTVPKKQWTEILTASQMSPSCPQFSMGDLPFTPDTDNMSEDCLYLNIWTPKPISNGTLKPVIIFIHPGAFQIGGTSTQLFDGSRLAGRGDVIVITINYRLGAFGFLLAYVEEANGNMGMYDQVMAIKWVKNNALAFGGDPVNIVLMGDSAGAMSVSFHMMSPISNHLFHKAIIQSGGAMNPYFLDNNTRLFANSESIASLTECANDTVNLRSNPKTVIDCLKRQPVGAFIAAMKIISGSQPIVLVPRVGDEFLPQSPAELLSDSKFRTDIPVLTGITSDEGTLLLTMTLPDHFGLYGESASKKINKPFTALTARGMFRIFAVSNATEILHYYMNTIRNKTAAEYSKILANIIGDYVVTCSTIFQADFFSSKGNLVYFYMFAARPSDTPFAAWMGTPHMAELQYVFGNPSYENFTDEDLKLSNNMIDRWSTFAKTGDPNIPGHIPWLQHRHEDPKFLKIEYEDKMIHMEPVERCKIWRTRFQAVMD